MATGTSLSLAPHLPEPEPGQTSAGSRRSSCWPGLRSPRQFPARRVGQRPGHCTTQYGIIDYENLRFHISFFEAAGRRLRRNYSFMFGVQAVSYITKICVHPTPIRSLQDLYEHAAIGPIPGQIVLAIGFLFHAGLVALAIFTLKGQRAVGRVA